MLKLSLPVALLLTAGAALPAISLPVCYMDMGGERIDLSYMCGSGGSAPVSTIAASSQSQSALTASVWTRNSHFDNVTCGRFGCLPTNTITGNIHNSGSAMATKIVVEATGYAEGRTAQTRRTTIARIAPNDARKATIDFGFTVPVDTWDVRVVSWE